MSIFEGYLTALKEQEEQAKQARSAREKEEKDKAARAQLEKSSGGQGGKAKGSGSSKKGTVLMAKVNQAGRGWEHESKGDEDLLPIQQHQQEDASLSLPRQRKEMAQQVSASDRFL